MYKYIFIYWKIMMLKRAREWTQRCFWYHEFIGRKENDKLQNDAIMMKNLIFNKEFWFYRLDYSTNKMFKEQTQGK